MTAQPNRFRLHLLGRLGLLVGAPVFVTALVVALIELHQLTGTWAPPSETEALVAAVVVASLLTLVPFLDAALGCPRVVRTDGSSLSYARYRWVRGRPGLYRIELRLESVESIRPTALDATEVQGWATVVRTDGNVAAQECPERLFLAPRTARALGIPVPHQFSRPAARRF
jgi:hypothetical protein